MAWRKINDTKLTAIADAIRGKTGKTAALTLDQMPAEIAGIETGTSATLIDFTLKYGLSANPVSLALQAEEGMTWGAWLGSKYDPFADNLKSGTGDYLYVVSREISMVLPIAAPQVLYNGNRVYIYDAIQSKATYEAVVDDFPGAG